MVKDSQKEAIKRYTAKCKQFCLRLRKDKDADLICWLDSQSSASESIKRLIRQDIAKKSKKV